MRVAVFYDWQNVYKTAREAFGWTNMPNEYGNFSPYQLARILAAGNGRGASGELVRVEIHRGLPSQKLDAVGYAANRRQSAAWMKEDPQTVIPRLRPLRYPYRYPQEPAVEKGVDVNLALGAIEMVLTDACDVAIVFSHDTDLAPLPEAIARLSRLRLSRPPRGRARASTNVCALRHRSTTITFRRRCSRVCIPA